MSSQHNYFEASIYCMLKADVSIQCYDSNFSRQGSTIQNPDDGGGRNTTYQKQLIIRTNADETRDLKTK